ncbi:PAC2 family protein [Corynebacterium sp. H113]|uniref:PAC2 family protein n=1 Tax=Corynebacterium sp. H113 TaxID=3133419 RepID=UPI0030AE0085
MERKNEQPANGMYEMQFPVPEVGGDKGGLTLVVALQGYADAGLAVANSATHLLDSLEHRPLVVFNNDELVDYRSRRPAVTMIGDEVADMTDLQLSLQVVQDNEGAPFLLLSGPEPDLRWDAFSSAVVELAEKFNVTKTISLYSAPMTVPHTRPMGLIAHGNDREILAKHRTWGQKVTVPGAASLRLELEMNRRGRTSCGFTAQVPHYVAHGEYPLAALRLLEAVADACGLTFPLASLESESKHVEQMLAQQIDESQEIIRIVGMLEQQYDEDEQRRRTLESNPLIGPNGDIPSADELGAEFEKFLASQLSQTSEPDDDVAKPTNPKHVVESIAEAIQRLEADEHVAEERAFEEVDAESEVDAELDNEDESDANVASTEPSSDTIADGSTTEPTDLDNSAETTPNSANAEESNPEDDDRRKKGRRGPRLPWFRF